MIKFLPCVGSANRSELYRHYAVVHYQIELKAEFGNPGHSITCIYCKKFVSIPLGDVETVVTEQENVK